MKEMNINIRTIFVVTQLDMLKAGNQILFRTIQVYLQNGYKVLLFTSNPENDPNRADYNSLLGEYAANLVVYRFNPLFRFLWKLFGKIKNKNKKSNLSIGENEENNIQKMEDIAPFVDASIKAGLIGFASQISFFLGGFLKLLKLTKEYQPAVIYGYEIYGAPLAYIVAKYFRLPFVTKFQGTIAFPILEKYKVGAWVRIPHHLIGLKTPGNLVFMDDDGTRGKEVLIKLKVKEEKIRSYINGVRKDIYIPNFERRQFLKELHLGEDSKVILSVSRLVSWKRVDRAIVAMTEVIKEVNNAVLIIVGDGPEKIKLDRLVKELKLNNNVIFVGPIPNDYVKYYFNAADIFLSLYDYSNLCNPVLEALECGKCIVTIDDGSTKGLLSNGYNAILVSREKIEKELPGIIVSLLSNDRKRNQIEMKARETSNQYLDSWEKRMDKEIKDVEKLLSNNLSKSYS
jgi:glycosyltransferase involved in cell wall biosynthesis